MILSFHKTTEVLLFGKKTVTRRYWSQNYIKRWLEWWDIYGKIVHQGFDKNPRAFGKKVCDIIVTERPYLQVLSDIPEEHLALEGGLWGSKDDFIKEFIQLHSFRGVKADSEVMVVHFRIDNITDYGHKIQSRFMAKKHDPTGG